MGVCVFYFDSFYYDAGMVGLDIGFDLCTAEVDAAFCLCGGFIYQRSLVLNSGACYVLTSWWICGSLFSRYTPRHKSRGYPDI
jgi:hypothetical protein